MQKFDLFYDNLCIFQFRMLDYAKNYNTNKEKNNWIQEQYYILYFFFVFTLFRNVSTSNSERNLFLFITFQKETNAVFNIFHNFLRYVKSQIVYILIIPKFSLCYSLIYIKFFHTNEVKNVTNLNLVPENLWCVCVCLFEKKC